MNLGLGVMIGLLGGNEETVCAHDAAVGKMIRDIDLADNVLHLIFDDSALELYDDGQSCCEYRYMHTDDDLSAFRDATFLGAEIRDAPDQEDECGDVHEVQFLLINTSLGTFTVETHNEHNGYYGGFWIVARTKSLIDPD